ncbi:MerR family transcriptional regulator [Streptomyces sp. TLI_171]|uniref:MerR family transcriptional regulator n=1 Tax=Streptomyces sp. TLI_171 TaxID=1938859 RepID=UPI000C193027|nr:MerR family transcriptional regulator [Streptomyces sp. TLI_171]RKE17422.1 B12 binding protein [Streptomyces sp. TLI_171]
MTTTAAVPGPGLPTGAVARLLGVSPTTVRSWERRYGIGPAGRVPGHHRRWRAEDVAVLEAMCRLTARGLPPGEAARAALAGGARLPPADAGRPPGGSRALRVGTVRPECRGLAGAAVRLDGPEVARVLAAAVDGLGAVAAWTEVVVPALRAAGRKWAVDGEQYVEVEHLLSWHVSAALRAVAVRPTGPASRGRPVLLAAMPEEEHSLPVEAVAAGLAERGVPFRMLGAAVPPRALLDAERRLGPAAVLLWSQGRRTADRRLVRVAAELTWGQRGARSAAAVLPAGPGWGRTPPPGAAALPHSLESALDLLHRATVPP